MRHGALARRRHVVELGPVVVAAGGTASTRTARRCGDRAGSCSCWRAGLLLVRRNAETLATAIVFGLSGSDRVDARPAARVLAGGVIALLVTRSGGRRWWRRGCSWSRRACGSLSGTRPGRGQSVMARGRRRRAAQRLIEGGRERRFGRAPALGALRAPRGKSTFGVPLSVKLRAPEIARGGCGHFTPLHVRTIRLDHDRAPNKGGAEQMRPERTFVPHPSAARVRFREIRRRPADRTWRPRRSAVALLD